MTVTEDDTWTGPPPPVIRPPRESAQERRTRVHVEANEWRERIEQGSDPLTDAAMVERIREAIRAAGGDPDRWTEWDAGPPPETAADDANPLGPYLIDWLEFWDAELDEQEWLLEPLFALRRSHALYAGAKTGKSYLVLAACAALATGRPFLLKPRSEPISVLYVDMEMTLEDLRDRLAEFGYGPDDDLSNLHYALLPSLPPLDTEAGGQALLAAALAVGAKFVIIDTTSRVIQGDENDADTMRAFYRHTGLLLKQHGIGWERLDHSGKDASKGQRGSSAKNDDVDVVIKLERTEKGQRITATHRRMSWFPEVTEIVVAESDGTMTFTMPVSATGAGWPAGTKEIADKLNELGLPLDVSARKASDSLRAAGSGHGYKKVQAAVKFRRQAAELAVEELVDNDAQTALGDRERGPDGARAHDERARDDVERAHPSEPLQSLVSTALGTDERTQAHPDSDRARSRASHGVDAPAGPAGRGPVEDDDEDPFA